MSLVFLFRRPFHIVISVFDHIRYIVEGIDVEIADIVFERRLGFRHERLHLDLALLVVFQSEIRQHAYRSYGGMGDGRRIGNVERLGLAHGFLQQGEPRRSRTAEDAGDDEYAVAGLEMLKQFDERAGVLRVVEHDGSHVGVALESHVEWCLQVLVGEEQREQRLVGIGLSLGCESVEGDIIRELHVRHIVEVKSEVGVHIVDIDKEITLFLRSVVELEVFAYFLVQLHESDGTTEVAVGTIGVDDDRHHGIDVGSERDTRREQHGKRAQHPCARSAYAVYIKFAHSMVEG